MSTERENKLPVLERKLIEAKGDPQRHAEVRAEIREAGFVQLADELDRIADTVVDANGAPVPVAGNIVVTDEFRQFMAGRVPAANCEHYIAKSEAAAGFTTCERCFATELT